MDGQFDTVEFAKKLLAFSPRLGINERKTAEFIVSILKTHGVETAIQAFGTQIPQVKRVRLEADGKILDGKACCFVSGTIEGKHSLISSLIPSRFFLDRPNINFNPECPAASLSNFYFAPAVAVSCATLTQILKAKKVATEVIIEPYRFESWNILVGDKDTPKKIFFAHYDSIESGCVDNASGVAVMMRAIVMRPRIMQENLLVFAGSEELSYDRPTYWGRGFRAFEEQNKNTMDKAEKLVAIDCVGNGKPVMDNGDNIRYLAFPVKRADRWKEKIFVMHADLAKENKVYHSVLDDIGQLNEKHLLAADALLAKEFTI